MAGLKKGESVHRVETDKATIRFSGGVVEDDSSSEEDEFCDSRSNLSFMSDNKKVLSSGSGEKISHQPHQSRVSDHVSSTEQQISNSNKVLENHISTETSSPSMHKDAEPVPDANSVVTSHRCDPALPSHSSDPCGHFDSGVADVEHTSARAGCSGCDTASPESTSTGEQSESATNTQSISQPNANSGYISSMFQRFNPFNRSDLDEQDTFPHLTEAQLRGAAMKNKFQTQDSEEFSDDLDDDDLSFRDSDKMKSLNAELGITEDYFAQPEGHFALTTVEELALAIQNCKQLVLQTPPGSDRMKNLVRKLVQLRLKRSEALETTEAQTEDFKVVVGHRFEEKEVKSSKRYCEKCNSVIWGMLQSWYKCATCGFCSHAKCLNLITRTCASVKVLENPYFIMSICPEKGLDSQNYRCTECRASISFQSGFSEPRQCDYTGSFYCEMCHWNDLMVLPSRVLHNWDFEPRKVCRASKQFLKLMNKKAVIRIQDLNPMLFSFVEELNDVKRLREEMLIMKKYFLSCKAALETKLLLQLQERQHFVENSDMYSLQDLEDVAVDVLLPEVAKIHASFAQHIKTDCQVCQGKGYICELCDDREILFPFDNIAVVCSQCTTVLHRHCFIRRNQRCPKCERISQRSAGLQAAAQAFEASLVS